MPGSGAGLNRVSGVILSVSASTTVVSTPLVSYGTIGVNDSGQSFTEAMGFKSWTFSLSGGGSGYSISIYGTNDPMAYAAWKASFNPQAYAGRVGGAPTLPASSWFLIDAPSAQTGTGSIANPMTSTSPLMQYKEPLIAVRAVLTASSAASGTVNVNVLATP